MGCVCDVNVDKAYAYTTHTLIQPASNVQVYVTLTLTCYSHSPIHIYMQAPQLRDPAFKAPREDRTPSTASHVKRALEDARHLESALQLQSGDGVLQSRQLQSGDGVLQSRQLQSGDGKRVTAEQVRCEDVRGEVSGGDVGKPLEESLRLRDETWFNEVKRTLEEAKRLEGAVRDVLGVHRELNVKGKNDIAIANLQSLLRRYVCILCHFSCAFVRVDVLAWLACA
jgi:hypothetical protein